MLFFGSMSDHACLQNYSLINRHLCVEVGEIRYTAPSREALTGGGDGANTLDLLVPSYSDNTQKLWEDVIDGFEKANPDIKVNLEVQSWDNLESVIATKVSAGEAPDIYNGGPFAGFAADELLYPAKDVVSADTFADFQDGFIKNASVDGTPYGIPFIASARALLVNNTLPRRSPSTLPRTWPPRSSSRR